MRDFKDVVIEARESKGISRDQLGEKLGLSRGFMTEMERNGRIPSPCSIYKLSEILSLDFEELINIAREEKIRVFIKKLSRRYSRAIEKVNCAKANGENIDLRKIW